MNGTINDLKQGLLKCAKENENRTCLTGQVVISLICESAKDTIEELEKENERLAKRICELQSDLSREKSTVEWLRRCSNCIHRFVFHYSQAGTCQKPGCKNYSEWSSDFQFLERMKSMEGKE